MGKLYYIFSGGFLAGKRTYIVGGLLIAQAVVQFAIGDIDLSGLADKLPEILGGMGLMSLRAGVQK